MSQYKMSSSIQSCKMKLWNCVFVKLWICVCENHNFTTQFSFWRRCHNHNTTHFYFLDDYNLWHCEIEENAIFVSRIWPIFQIFQQFRKNSHRMTLWMVFQIKNYCPEWIFNIAIYFDRRQWKSKITFLTDFDVRNGQSQFHTKSQIVKHNFTIFKNCEIVIIAISQHNTIWFFEWTTISQHNTIFFRAYFTSLVRTLEGRIQGNEIDNLYFRICGIKATIWKFKEWEVDH